MKNDPKFSQFAGFASLRATYLGIVFLGVLLLLKSELHLLVGIQWFAFALAMLTLILLFSVLRKLPRSWRESRVQTEKTEKLEEGSPDVWSAEFPTTLTPVELASLMARLENSDLKRLGKSKSDGSTISLQLGRFSCLALWGAHLVLVGALGGVAASLAWGYQARIFVAEGQRTDHAEPVRGSMPESWPSYSKRGRPFPEFRNLGFEVECKEIGLQTKVMIQGREHTLTLGSSIRSGAHEFRWVGSGPASGRDIDVTVTEAGPNGRVRRFPKASRGEGIDLDAYRFEVIEIQPETELNGAAAQIEYQENGKALERFWIFHDFPNYDGTHRKESQTHFTLHSVNQRRTAELLVGSDPGASVARAGLATSVVLILLATLFPHRRWSVSVVSNQGGIAGKSKVRLLAWSSQTVLFAPQFESASAQLRRKLARVKK